MMNIFCIQGNTPCYVLMVVHMCMITRKLLQKFKLGEYQCTLACPASLYPFCVRSLVGPSGHVAGCQASLNHRYAIQLMTWPPYVRERADLKLWAQLTSQVAPQYLLVIHF